MTSVYVAAEVEVVVVSLVSHACVYVVFAHSSEATHFVCQLWEHAHTHAVQLQVSAFA